MEKCVAPRLDKMWSNIRNCIVFSQSNMIVIFKKQCIVPMIILAP